MGCPYNSRLCFGCYSLWYYTEEIRRKWPVWKGWKSKYFERWANKLKGGKGP